IMQPLQQRLLACGCIGMVWQAGRGNPVAGGNFMLAPRDRTGQSPMGERWVWIDLESGIPALLPLNPLAMLTCYLPQMLKRRALLFDDIDVPKLHAYLTSHRDAIVASVGDEAMTQLDEDVAQL